MPILNVKISARKSAEMSRAISSMLLELTARILKKQPEVTSVAISYVDPEDWIIGGKAGIVVQHRIAIDVVVKAAL